jgi:hypothetical protein
MFVSIFVHLLLPLWFRAYSNYIQAKVFVKTTYKCFQRGEKKKEKEQHR